MNRPTIKSGCAAPAGVGTLLLLWAVLSGCLPDVGPVVPTPVTPTPIVPVPGSGLRVLIVEETSRRDRLLPDQVDIFTSAEFRRALKAMKVELRIWDEMVDAENESDAAFRAMLQQSRTSLPWIVISGKTVVSQSLPKDVAATIKLIEGAR